ncbi:hypothetical protein BDV93DRAFT_547649 [Ceratobasidium sp. AG-I]|nr:hypothetical protein BDV93DRAFT_547649 [Ceratobasidium sp. AG-I]
MVQVSPPQTNAMAAIYTPPQLPAYLASAFDLKPITGIPTNEEVKLIHSVIRVVENTSHNYGLTSCFEARYKSQYSFSVFSDITYSPPVLPSHMNIPLEPVVTAPTDDQIRSVQTALRFSESMASAPTMYDADLSLQLSQHLFDIQLALTFKLAIIARYVQRAALVHQTPQAPPSPGIIDVPSVQEHYPVVERAQSLDGASYIPEDVSVSRDSRRDGQELAPERASGSSDRAAVPHLPDLPSDQVLGSQELIDTGEDQVQQAEVKGLLIDINESLQELRRTVILTHNSMARGVQTRGGNYLPIILNSKGEDPVSYGIKEPGYLNRYMGDANLARFFKYFGIGEEFLEAGPEPSIKSGAFDEDFSDNCALVESAEDLVYVRRATRATNQAGSALVLGFGRLISGSR